MTNVVQSGRNVIVMFLTIECYTCFFMAPSRPLFLYFYLFYDIQLIDKFLPLLGFKLQISGVRSDGSANCATTTAQCYDC